MVKQCTFAECGWTNQQSARFCARCNALFPGTILKGMYVIVRLLGRGGFGAAYLAHDQDFFTRECVVKQLLIPQGTSSNEVAELRDGF